MAHIGAFTAGCQAHRLMQLWSGGDESKVNDYLDARGLTRHALFGRLLQAVIEMAPAGLEERAILESLSEPCRRPRRRFGRAAAADAVSRRCGHAAAGRLSNEFTGLRACG